MLSDRVWKQTTPLEVAMNGFCPTNIVSLRVVKCRPICGLDESVKLAENYWLASETEEGKDNSVAVIHFYKKK